MNRMHEASRWVIKLGSSLLTNDGQGLDRAAIGDWVAQVVQLLKQGKEVLLVSSGAVAEGMHRLGLSKRPHSLHLLQATAAVGQMGLVQAYESEFQKYGYHTAQILLTHDDLSDRKRYLNARSTLLSLLNMNIVPIINENDTVVTEEIRFGDNDTLGALVANLVEAGLLVILTDQAGLYEEDPRRNSQAKLIEQALADDPVLDSMAQGSISELGRGGMFTKLRAARLAARSGACTWLAYGREPDILLKLLAGERKGTLLYTQQEPLAARKRWLAGHLQMKGSLILDDGAVRVLKQGGKSLLPVGVKAVKGQFRRGEMVACMDSAGNKIACGLVNYDAEEACRIAGKSSEQIETVLGYINEPELIHRDNLAVT